MRGILITYYPPDGAKESKIRLCKRCWSIYGGILEIANTSGGMCVKKNAHIKKCDQCNVDRKKN